MRNENEIMIGDPQIQKVHVFKTNVAKRWQAEMLCEVMAAEFPFSKSNFDLEDIDRIFRIESIRSISLEVIEVFQRHGFEGEEL
jgi:hypothetical protein